MKFQKSATAEKLKKMMSRQRLQSLFTFGLGGLLLFQMVQFYQFRERLKFIDDLYERDSAVMSDLDKGKDYLSSFGSDLNEIRQFLLLPTKEYDFSDLDDVDLASEDSGLDLNTQMFDFVSSLGKYEENQALYATNLAAVQEGVKDPVWSTAGLSLVSVDGQALEDHMEFVFKDDEVELLKIDLGYDGLFAVPLYYRELKLTDRSSWDRVFADVQDFLKDDLPDLRTLVSTVNGQRAALKSLLAAADLQKVLTDKGMALSGEQENDESFYYQLRNSQLVALGAFTVFKSDGRMEFSVEAGSGDMDELALGDTTSADLLAALREVDARTDGQKKLDEKKAEMEEIMEDRAFLATLDKLGLHFGSKTETTVQIQYPLLDENGQTLRIIFIDKLTMEVKVELPDGTQVQSLTMATNALLELSKKKAWICLTPSRVTLNS